MRAINWSVNLETEEYVADRDLIITDACEAVRDTTPGHFVNLAVAPDHGDPADYLVPALLEHFASAISVQFVDQCGCGGYVFRVTRKR